MSDITETGEVSDEIIQKLKAIQEEVSPSVLGVPPETTIANLEKHVLPQCQSNLFGAIYKVEDGIAARRSGSLNGHTSIKHDLKFFGVGDTVVCFGLGDGADYDENGNKVTEHLNFPFCDVFARVDGRWRLLAVTASAVPEESSS